MNILWKGVTAVLIAGSAMMAASAPAQARDHRDGYRYGQHYRGDGWRGDRWRGDRWDRHHRREARRDWRRDNRRYAWRGEGRRCWNEWRYDRYRHRDVRVRICR